MLHRAGYRMMLRRYTFALNEQQKSQRKQMALDFEAAFYEDPMLMLKIWWSDECSIDLSESIRGREFSLVAPCTCIRDPNVAFVCQCDNKKRPRNQKVKQGLKLMVRSEKTSFWY